ncbi:DNA cytosine methyltransferase [bacterium]|nr:DNA cytosine methyltransferase [bacterium]
MQKRTTNNRKQYCVLDLFCGCGGLSLGFEQSEFGITLGIDNWNEALNTFEKNHKNSEILCADLSDIKPQEISKIHKNFDIIIGGPPCQGFSISGKRNPYDPRNKLYQSFVSFVGYFKPKAFIMENVPNLVAMNNGKVKEQIILEFEELGYKIVYKILLASNFGVPQNRKRVIFVGLKNGKKFEFPEGKFLDKKVISFDAISDLPKNEVQDGTQYVHSPKSDYQKIMRKNSKGIYNHKTTKHTNKTKKMIALVPDGGNYKDLPKELQGTRKVNIAWTRLNSKKPSFTIDTGHRHHFHYKFNRIPTVREAARMQSFPDNFIFSGTLTDQHKQVGNAVPPLLAYEISKKLLKQI